MTFSRLCVVLGFAALMVAPGVRGQALLDSLTSNLNIEGLETTYDPETGLATANGDVRISYTDVEIRCGTASYNATTGEVIARDNVVIWKAGTTYRGDNIIYNANSGELSGDAVRSAMPMDMGNFFYETTKFETETKLIQKVEGEDTYFTTHDVQNPNFRLRARKLTIYPGNRIVMRNVTVLAGNTPVFYFPYISQPLEDEVGYRFTPGFQSRWGAFLLAQYGVIHGDHTLAKYRLDLRSARGVGVGADFLSLRHKENRNNFGNLKLYYLKDSDPDKNRTGVARGPVGEDRYRINFQHRIYLPGPEKSTWYLDFDINKVSDAHFYEDFYFNDFRETPEPENQISLVHNNPAYLATLMARFQANDFYTVGTKLPELAIDWTRRQLWHTGIYHQGTFSAGILKDELGDEQERDFAGLITEGRGGVLSADSTRRYQDILGLGTGSVLGAGDIARGVDLFSAQLEGAGFARVHTYQELLYPKTLFGWLNVVPRVGGGVTHYSDIDGASPELSSETKTLFHAGLDVSFKVTKTWSDYYKPEWGLDGLRHVLQPYLNYSYLDASQATGFRGVDRLSPTTRPRSIDVPLYTAVDDLQSWNIARIGMRNLLQTKRDYTSTKNGTFYSATSEGPQTYTWAGLNTYVDVFLKDPEFDRNFSNLYNELFFRPVPWVNFWMDWQMPLESGEGSFTELNQGVTFMPGRNMQLTLGHQYVSDSPYFADSSLVFSRIYARLTDNWGFSMNHIFEMDDGTMEFQSYSVSRDLSSWVASVGAMVRDNRNGLSDYGILFSLTLKDFPQLSMPLDIDPNPSGRGGNQ
ncbi:organic solvent tolerance protein [Prosthecobacter fusiformis]|uniref:Organic solvent tolerance protein n=1 Tax=Prosthecobacter fusiformis TaxID=48464 RepID=A0A4V3FG18_9BACT|nr:LPS assembly protein LptD [Prosthecobacter fusiformis]TDU72943.1 organic solvent tolerance protein [Prosthecobacter fusiformis]